MPLPAIASPAEVLIADYEEVGEELRYAARPGLGALPPGTAMWFAFAGLQVLPVTCFLWAIWWPRPIAWSEIAFAVGGTGVMFALALMVAIVLVRRSGGAALGMLVAPFIRLTVSDRRVSWRVPWRAEPLMEIGADRVRGGILGDLDRRGRGAAAIILAPGDFAAGRDGLVHFDRLPRAERFVDALRRMR